MYDGFYPIKEGSSLSLRGAKDLRKILKVWYSWYEGVNRGMRTLLRNTRTQTSIYSELTWHNL